SASLMLNTAIRIPDPTRMTPVMTNATETLSVCWLSKPTGIRIQVRLKAAARVSAARAQPREAAAIPIPMASTGGPGIFPIPVFAANPHAVRTAPARAMRAPTIRVSRERSRVLGSGRSRIARTMFKRLTRHDATRIVIQVNAVPATNAVTTDVGSKWNVTTTSPWGTTLSKKYTITYPRPRPPRAPSADATPPATPPRFETRIRLIAPLSLNADWARPRSMNRIARRPYAALPMSRTIAATLAWTMVWFVVP